MAEEKGVLSIEEIKTLIKELGGYKKVAEEIGVTEKGLANSISNGKLGNQTIKSLFLLKDNQKMKKDLEILETFRNFFSKK